MRVQAQGRGVGLHARQALQNGLADLRRQLAEAGEERGTLLGVQRQNAADLARATADAEAARREAAAAGRALVQATTQLKVDVCPVPLSPPAFFCAHWPPVCKMIRRFLGHRATKQASAQLKLSPARVAHIAPRYTPPLSARLPPRCTMAPRAQAAEERGAALAAEAAVLGEELTRVGTVAARATTREMAGGCKDEGVVPVAMHVEEARAAFARHLAQQPVIADVILPMILRDSYDALTAGSAVHGL